MMKLISEKLNNQLNDLIGKCFEINRMLDRGMSLLAVRWGMINSSRILHEKVAHAYPSDKFADAISDYQGLRGMESVYPATQIGNKDYATILDFFKDYFRENIDFEDMIKDAILLSTEEEDYRTKMFLDKLMNNLSPYIELSQDLITMIEACDNDKFKLIMLDSEIDDLINI